MTDIQIQEMLLNLLPQWNYRIAKPFKQLLDEGVSLEMYYCLKTLQWGGGTMTMSELGRYTKSPKDQMTKMSNRLVEQELVERVYDPSDRRVIKLRLTDKAQDYMNGVIENDAKCFAPLLGQLTQEDKDSFGHALELLAEILSKLPCDGKCNFRETNLEISSNNRKQEDQL